MEAGVRDLWSPGEAFVPECPLCSGKVKPDDPAAQALDWGVRTAEAGEGGPGFWKAAHVAQTYHDSAAGTSALMDEFAAEASRANSESTLWQPTPEQRQQVGTSSYGEQWGGSGPGIWWEPKSGDGEEDEGGDGEGRNRTIPNVLPVGDKCCPDPIKFPTSENVVEGTPGKQGMPWLGVPQDQTRLATKIAVMFKGTVTFKPAPVPCVCACCEFRHLIQSNRFTLSNCTSPPPKTSTDSPNAGGHEDCNWAFIRLDPSGRPMRLPNGKLAIFYQPGRRTKPPKPWYTPSRLISGPHCKGHRKEIPSGVPESPPRPTGWPAPIPYPPDSNYGGGGCLYTFEDSPSQVVPAGCTFNWKWKSTIQIIDACEGGGGDSADYEFHVAGSADATGKITYTAKPGGVGD